MMDALCDDDTEPLLLALRDGVVDEVANGDISEVTERVPDGETDGLTDGDAVTLPVMLGVTLRDALTEPVTVEVTLELTEPVRLALTLEVTEPVTLAVTLELPDCDGDTELLRVVELVALGETEGVVLDEMLTEREAVAETLAEIDGDAEDEAEADALGLGVGLLLGTA